MGRKSLREIAPGIFGISAIKETFRISQTLLQLESQKIPP
jgi:hypothetical protein